MEKSARNCPVADCPGLDAGPKSLEHQRRFEKRGGTAGSVPAGNTASMIKGAGESKTAKTREELR